MKGGGVAGQAILSKINPRQDKIVAVFFFTRIPYSPAPGRPSLKYTILAGMLWRGI